MSGSGSPRAGRQNPKIRLGVAGWPVAHSRSPLMQNAALAAAGLGDRWHYQHLPIPPELFEQTVRGLPASGFRGINVTIPHKEAALALADTSSERAKSIGAANTLVFGPENTIRADNTDAPALSGALQAVLPAGAAGRTALVLGAGGSARAAAWALLDQGAASVTIWNRTPERARQLAKELGAQAALDPAPAQIIVNCTSVGLEPGDSLESLPISAQLLGACELIVDFVYSAGTTPLAAGAGDLGVAVVDGLELLIRQGAESFTAFTGLPAPIDAMRAAVAASTTR